MIREERDIVKRTLRKTAIIPKMCTVHGVEVKNNIGTSIKYEKEKIAVEEERYKKRIVRVQVKQKRKNILPSFPKLNIKPDYKKERSSSIYSIFEAIVLF